jgi:hypothetical protein
MMLRPLSVWQLILDPRPLGWKSVLLWHRGKLCGSCKQAGCMHACMHAHLLISFCLRAAALCCCRYHSLRQLFSIPDSFVEEFVVQEPELLCMSADTLKAKFDSLLRK